MHVGGRLCRRPQSHRSGELSSVRRRLWRACVHTARSKRPVVEPWSPSRHAGVEQATDLRQPSRPTAQRAVIDRAQPHSSHRAALPRHVRGFRVGQRRQENGLPNSTSSSAARVGASSVHGCPHARRHERILEKDAPCSLKQLLLPSALDGARREDCWSSVFAVSIAVDGRSCSAATQSFGVADQHRCSLPALPLLDEHT